MNKDQMNSALRHVYTAVGTATAVLVVVGLSQQDATAIGVAVKHIGDGIASIVAGVSLLIPVFSAAWAAYSASRANRLHSLNADPEIKKIETVPGTQAAAEAAAIPGSKVV